MLSCVERWRAVESGRGCKRCKWDRFLRRRRTSRLDRNISCESSEGGKRHTVAKTIDDKDRMALWSSFFLQNHFPGWAEQHMAECEPFADCHGPNTKVDLRDGRRIFLLCDSHKPGERSSSAA
jgi:hypothetical protein